MSRYLDQPVAQRKPLPLTEQDLRDLELIRNTDTARHQALVDLAGREPADSDSAYLHALLEVALRAVADEAREEGYRQLAASWSDETSETRSTRSRRAARKLQED